MSMMYVILTDFSVLLQNFQIFLSKPLIKCVLAQYSGMVEEKENCRVC